MTYIISPKIVTMDTLNYLLEMVKLQPVAVPLFARLTSKDGKRWFLTSSLDDDTPITRMGKDVSSMRANLLTQVHYVMCFMYVLM